MLKGIPVTLLVKTQTGLDPASRPIYSWEPVTVENVLVAPTSDEEVLSTLNLTGRRAEYVLGIPKTDAHTRPVFRRDLGSHRDPDERD